MLEATLIFGVPSARVCLRGLETLPKRRIGIDLFAGAGGLSLGFSAAGYDMAAAVDNDQAAIETLRSNSPGRRLLAIQEDLCAFGPRAFSARLAASLRGAEVDLVVAGPPCQGWSKVGRGKLRSLGREDPELDPFRDPRNTLFWSFIEYTAHFKPAVCVMENVPGMSHYRGRDFTPLVANEIAQLGYKLTAARVEAGRLGVPQQRFRLLFVGVREDLGAKFSAPTSPPADIDSHDAVLRDAIGDLPRIPDGAHREVLGYHADPYPSAYVRLLRPKWMSRRLSAHVTRTHRRQDLVAFRMLRQGGIYSDLPRRLRRYRTDIFRDKYRRLSWDRKSPCITAHLAKDGYSHIHPSQARTISVREAARIQSFPDWYCLRGNMGERFRLIGNAVPPLVSYGVARSIRECLGERVTGSWVEYASSARSDVRGGAR